MAGAKKPRLKDGGAAGGLAGMKIALCQIKVVPGRPDRNVETILARLEEAALRGCDLAVFPEMSVPGYLIGDAWEDEGLVRDVLLANERIREATRSGIAAIWGSLLVDPGRTNEDGRLRKYNAGFVAQGGELKDNGVTKAAVKTLLPEYRIFDDPRHFTSLRQLTADPSALLRPFPVRQRGRAAADEVRIGLHLCEDMWHENYPVNPPEILVGNGANLLVNISASPWTWQKNRKRHEVVRSIVARAKVPFVYVNAIGVQNNGKNLIVFDGCSAVYGSDGSLVLALEDNTESVVDLTLSPSLPTVDLPPQDDSRELFEALCAALNEFLSGFPEDHRHVVVGVSGGIDSATVLALLVHLLGPSRVSAISMPSKFNGPTTLGLTAHLARTLGVSLETVPIQGMVDQLAAATGITPVDFAYENIQARVRMQVLAALAQKRHALFTCNGNKVELAFGYSTLYGDQAGAIAPLGDLVKREVRQLAVYLNEKVFGRDVIPQSCIEMKPSAELSPAQSVEEGKGDPFDYGSQHARGYHDEMVRAFTEFRKGPEWFLEEWASGRLETTLLLPSGTLERLFVTPAAFAADLEEKWSRFAGSVFKRVQAPPIPIVSRRSFGYDLREAMLAPHFTSRYRDLKKAILSRQRRVKRIAVYGGSFNPPSRHHQEIARRLTAVFAKVVVVPCWLRSDKASVGAVAPEHRRRMAEIAFLPIPGLELDLTDMEQEAFTPTWKLDERMKAEHPGAEVWHVVGGDIIAGGRAGGSEIQRSWQRGKEIWKSLHFAVLTRAGSGMQIADLPPNSRLIDASGLFGSGTVVRERLALGEDVLKLVEEPVLRYIKENGLYGMGASGEVR